MTTTQLADSFDLAAYLTRIGYAGPARADLETLKKLVQAHSQAIAFENLDPFLGRPVRLDMASLQGKLVNGGRGGYCFEQNILLRHALDATGFTTTALGARVMWQRDDKAPMPARSHMLIRVLIGGTAYVVDVGFGGMTLTGVLVLDSREPQETPHEPFQVVSAGADLMLQVRVAGDWKPIYRFDLQAQFLADYEQTSWYLSHNPDSHFVTGLIAAKPTPTGRLALSGSHLAAHYLDGPSEHRDLTSAVEIIDTLQQVRS